MNKSRSVINLLQQQWINAINSLTLDEFLSKFNSGNRIIMEFQTPFHDIQLLRKIADKDQRAFKTAYERYNKRIYSISLKLTHSVELSEELTQEVFLRLWTHPTPFNDFDHLEAWLRTTARNLSLNAFKRILLEKKADRSLAENYKDGHHATEETILLNDAKALLGEAIQTLPTQQREIYILCQQDGLSYEDAAMQMNISVNTLKTHMKRALSAVRLYMKKHSDIAAILIFLKIF